MNRLVYVFYIFLFSITAVQANHNTLFIPDTLHTAETEQSFLSDSLAIPLINNEIPLIAAYDSFKVSNYKKKKLMAAILSFPFPFGLLGLHRIALGTKPYIPFVYIGTLGGCFLVLPIVDFIAILSADEEAFKQFENNPRVFMWAK